MRRQIDSGCKKCGKCCNERISGLTVFKKEPVYEEIKLTASLLGDKASFKESNSILSIDFKQEGCLFYDNGCSIYEIRPLSCRIFPFVAEVEEGSARFVVTGHCSMVHEFEKREIDFLCLSDIIGRSDNDTKLPLLMTSLKELLSSMNRGIIPEGVTLGYDNGSGELIIPVSGLPERP